MIDTGIKNRTMLDKKIIYFMSVVEEGSFTGAAKKFLLSQSAMSQQVALLERELSVKLFDRTGYKPVLTEVGKTFYHGICSINKQCDELQNNIRKISRNTIRIGFTGTFENRKIIEIINRIKKNNPDILISILEGNFEECVQNLINNQVDIAFGLESDYRDRDDIEYQCLYQYDMCVICSFNHALAEKEEVSISELKNESFIFFSKDYGKMFYQDYLDAFKKDGIKPKIKKSVDSVSELQFLVSIGEGIAIISKEVVINNVVKILNIKDTHHRNNYVISYHKGKLNPLVEYFLEEVKEYFKSL